MQPSQPSQPSEAGPRFLPTEARRRALVSLVALAFVACLYYLAAVAQAILVGGSSGVVWLLYVVEGIYVLCGSYFLLWGLYNWQIVYRGYTELTPAGLVVKQVRVRLVEWGTITDIERVHRGRFWRVRVRRSTGRRLVLVAPVTRAYRPDPRFTAELETMRAWWSRARQPL